MPVHDWKLVDDGTWHSFHNGWITHLSEALNGGLLPKGYYSLAEQHSLHYVADVLTLHADSQEPLSQEPGGGVSVAEVAPRVGTRQLIQPSYKLLRRTLAIRRESGHRIVALIEILSPGNKDGPKSLQQFVDKATDAIRNGCHLLVIDLFPPARSNPRGIHAALINWWLDETYALPQERPLTLAAYEVPRKGPIEAYLEHVAVGQLLPEMPLFLREGFYVDVPLQATYDAAFRGLPEFYRQRLQKSTGTKRRGNR